MYEVEMVMCSKKCDGTFVSSRCKYLTFNYARIFQYLEQKIHSIILLEMHRNKPSYNMQVTSQPITNVTIDNCVDPKRLNQKVT